MIVYIYHKESNKKLFTYKNIVTVTSTADNFLLVSEDGLTTVQKDNIKLVVYGF